MTMIAASLRAEAAAEVRRLERGRAMIRGGDERALARLESDAAWIAAPRRWRLRRALGRRACLLWRAAFEDACGRVVESRLVPVVVDPEWQVFEPAIRARVEAECDEWAGEVARVINAFTSARLARERRIGLHRRSARNASQPGLFDRRAERAIRSHDTAAAESERDALDRLRALASAGAIARLPARLLLVLVP